MGVNLTSELRKIATEYKKSIDYKLLKQTAEIDDFNRRVKTGKLFVIPMACSTFQAKAFLSRLMRSRYAISPTIKMSMDSTLVTVF